jgi:hypothetical protein
VKTPFRRTRRGGNDSPASVSVHEHLPADAESALVRVAGSWDGPGPCPLHEAQLVVQAGGAGHSFDPLPAPPAADGGRSWRLAFAVPVALLQPVDAREFLRTTNGTIIELPEATRRALAHTAQPEPTPGTASAQPEPVPTTDADCDRCRDRIEALEAQIDELQRRCERQLDDLRGTEDEQLLKAWTECAQLRELIADREEELERTSAEAARLRRREKMLREGLDEITAGLAEWREKTEAECDRLNAEIAARDAALANADDAQRQVVELRAELDRAQTQVADLERELAAVSATRTEVETSASGAAAELQALVARAEDAERRAADAEAVAAREDSPAPTAELEAARERIAVLEAHAAEADRLREKLERRGRRPIFGRRHASGESELSEQLAATTRESENLERQVAGLAEQLRTSEEQHETETERARGAIAELEHQLDKQRQVEEDLRALLDSERRQAAEARLVADGLRLRLADLPADDLPAPAPPPEEARTTWSAMDEELLARLERAKAAAGA